jgi:hypothetical protein
MVICIMSREVRPREGTGNVGPDKETVAKLEACRIRILELRGFLYDLSRILAENEEITAEAIWQRITNELARPERTLLNASYASG